MDESRSDFMRCRGVCEGSRQADLHTKGELCSTCGSGPSGRSRRARIRSGFQSTSAAPRCAALPKFPRSRQGEAPFPSHQAPKTCKALFCPRSRGNETVLGRPTVAKTLIGLYKFSLSQRHPGRLAQRWQLSPFGPPFSQRC